MSRYSKRIAERPATDYTKFFQKDDKTCIQFQVLLPKANKHGKYTWTHVQPQKIEGKGVGLVATQDLLPGVAIPIFGRILNQRAKKRKKLRGEEKGETSDKKYTFMNIEGNPANDPTEINGCQVGYGGLSIAMLINEELGKVGNCFFYHTHIVVKDKVKKGEELTAHYGREYKRDNYISDTVTAEDVVDHNNVDMERDDGIWLIKNTKKRLNQAPAQYIQSELQKRISIDPPNIYLVLLGEPLALPPPDWEEVQFPVNQQWFFDSVLTYRTIYSLPVICSLQKLTNEWSPLSNKHHMDQNFEEALTKIEKEYLDIVKKENKGVDWDISGKWTGVHDIQGVGVVLDESTIVLGFTNTINKQN